jgi:type IV fimbrial biogenesis protein FimT
MPDRHSRGFTAVELMVALAVFALIAAFATPSLRVFVANQRLRSASFELVSELVSARSEALKRNVSYRIVARDDGWSSGWVVQTQQGGSWVSVRTQDPLAPGLTLSAVPAFSELQFDRNGRVLTPAVRVRFELGATDLDRVTKRCVTLDPTGRARSERRACS